MGHAALIRLMHEVLDGAASEDEARELNQLLANDAVARAEFEELRRLFQGLNTMPPALPPEGLVAAVLARLPRQSTRRNRLRQLSSRWRVLSVDSGRAQGSLPVRTSRTQRFSQHTIRRNRDMSGPNIFSRRPKLWIGAGIAVIAIVLVARYFDFPPGQNTEGTIAPAKRVVAEQPGAGDVNGGQSAGSPTTVPVPGDAQNAAGSNAGSQNAGGQNAGGQNAAGQNAAGQNAAGQNAAGQNAGGQNAGGLNAGGQNAAGIHNAGGQNAAGQNAAGIHNAGGQNAAGQNAAGQNAGGQNAAGIHNAGGQNAGGQNAGGQNAAGQNAAGIHNAASQNAASQNAASQNAAAQNAAAQQK
jgi:hypothetical protein